MFSLNLFRTRRAGDRSAKKQHRQSRFRTAHVRRRRLLAECLEDRRLLDATVLTDKPNYSAGDTAYIGGDGFAVGETVELQVLHMDGVPNTGAGHSPWQVVDGGAGDLDALANGQVETNWYVDPDDSFGSTFQLTATGLTSGLTAQWTFTDAAAGAWSINDVSQNEGDSGATTFTFTVTFVRTGNGNVNVNYATANGTTNPATGGASCGASIDYVTTSGTVSFSGNTSGSQSVQVTVCGDTDNEANETFFVDLSGQTSGTTISDGQGLGTIQNDDTTIGTLTVVIAASSVAENTGANATTATVTRTGDTTSALIVNLTSNDTTEATVPTMVTIPANESSVTFEIAAVDDTLLDGTQMVTITAGTSGYTTGNDTLDVTDYETLTVVIAAASVAENAGAAATTATVTRSNTDISSPLTVTLLSSDVTEATVPGTVVIPANQNSKTFDIDAVDDALLDGTQTVTITASASGYVSGSDMLDVTDHETLTVAIAAASVAENAGAAATTGTVTRSNTDTGSPLTVSLASDDTSEATVAASVTIPANQSSVSFNIDAVDDALLDGTQTVTITASASGYLSGSDMLDVTDHETLTVAIAAASVAENAGAAATTGTVTRSNTDTGSPLTVNLGSDDTSEATVPASVTIPANQSSVSFDIAAVDDALLDGTQTVTITAGASAYLSGSDMLDVTDHETLTVAIAAASVAENAGAAATTGTVTRSNTDTVLPMTVSLASDDTSEATVAASVTIPANQSSVSFDIAAVDDALLDGTQTVTITASASGYVSGSDMLDVTDRETLTVAIAAASVAENAGAAATTGTVTRSNTDTSLPLTVSLASSDTTEATVPASVTIPANQSSVSFDIDAVDDALSDGTVTVTITASASGYVSGSDTLGVTDNEPAFVDPGYSETGLGWELVLNALEPQYPGYGGDWRYHAGFGAGAAVATWEATNVTPGQFKVYVTWVPFNNRASNARYTIYDGAMIAGAFQLDQEYPPVADLMLGGRPFQSLGTYTIESTSLSVKLTDDANGYVIADHAVFERVGELPAMLTLAMGVDQASEPSGTATATLTRKYGGTSTDLEVTLQSSDTSEATVPATVTIPAGFTSVTFDVMVVDDAVADRTQTVTITATATGFLGAMDSLQVTDDETWTVDDEDPGYSETPVWTQVAMPAYPGYAGTGDPSFGDWRYRPAGTGSSVATWEVTTNRPGQYEVFVTWAPFPNRATHAPYQVYDGPAAGGVLEGTFHVNQRNTPVAHVTFGGRPFQRLGTFNITSNTLAVTLSDLANNYVIADAVQFARIGDLSPLRAAGGAAGSVGGATVPSITAEQAQPLLAEAAARWQAAGLAENVQVVIADLPGDLLGLASSSTHTIWLDADAAGYGWFVDATPEDDREFGGEPDAAGADRMDALSVIFHELGHLQGWADVDAFLHPYDPMADVLAVGVRQTPRLADLSADHGAACSDPVDA